MKKMMYSHLTDDFSSKNYGRNLSFPLNQTNVERPGPRNPTRVSVYLLRTGFLYICNDPKMTPTHDWPELIKIYIHPTYRLSVPMETSIDLIRARIPYPKGVIPPLALPSWHFMALEKKIPMLQSPKDLFYYTRGRLGEKVLLKTNWC